MNRTDFEAAYIERYGHRPRGWNDDFQVYQDAHANGAWFGWQARAAGIEAKAAPVGEREAFEAWTRKEYAFDDDMLRKSNEGHYSYAKPANMWDAYQAGAARQRQQVTDWHPSGADYDRRIHSNPDAKAWADFFVATFPGLSDKHELMFGWFANAMMAMHDHLKAQQAREVVMPERITLCGTPDIAKWQRGWNACLDEFARLNKGAGSHE